MINVFSALMEKGDNMQEQMGNVIGGTETLRKNPQEILEINTLQQKKNDLKDSAGGLTWSRKESVSLKYVNRNFPNWNAKGNKNNNNKGMKYPRPVRQVQQVQHMHNGHTRRRRKKEQRNI